MWETVVHTENRFIYTQSGSYRDCTLDISRKIKNKLNVLKFSFSWGFTNTFRAVYMTCGPRACEHSRHLFRITWKISPFGPCHFKIIVRNIKAIFKENFSSLRVDPGKIFEITIFTRGPNVTGIYALYFKAWHIKITENNNSLRLIVNDSWSIENSFRIPSSWKLRRKRKSSFKKPSLISELPIKKKTCRGLLVKLKLKYYFDDKVSLSWLPTCMLSFQHHLFRRQKSSAMFSDQWRFEL